MEQDRNRTAHRCQCPDCKQDRGGRLTGQHAAIIAFLAILNERDRRRMAAFLARQVFGEKSLQFSFLRGQSQRQTERILGVSEGAVRYHLRRARDSVAIGGLRPVAARPR